MTAQEDGETGPKTDPLEDSLPVTVTNMTGHCDHLDRSERPKGIVTEQSVEKSEKYKQCTDVHRSLVNRGENPMESTEMTPGEDAIRRAIPESVPADEFLEWLDRYRGIYGEFSMRFVRSKLAELQAIQADQHIDLGWLLDRSTGAGCKRFVDIANEA